MLPRNRDRKCTPEKDRCCSEHVSGTTKMVSPPGQTRPVSLKRQADSNPGADVIQPACHQLPRHWLYAHCYCFFKSYSRSSEIQRHQQTF
ncbi:hypothetical protein RIB2604_01710750 [Aspergillus luchuensis]|uniref:Uncharacterized protein n=1 Tax=Aspergillus kawachii TaxID=1069201 RepID=A0A146FEA4_ASPKA|nr:hypothetical protein RIB2604_01710750 [Aspergillus luchuensis]